MDNIDKEQYSNLRRNFNMLVKIVLGSHYYNNAPDVYQSDIECCKDIRIKIYNLKNDLRMYKNLFYGTLLFVFILILYIV